MPLQVADNGAVAQPPFIGPVIDPDDRRLPRLGHRRSADEPQKRVGARGHAKRVRQTGPALAAGSEGNLLQGPTQAMAPPRTGRHQLRQAFGEEAARTRWGHTVEPAYLDIQHDAAATQREIRHSTPIAGVLPCGPLLTER